jgi:hypothetical protein
MEGGRGGGGGGRSNVLHGHATAPVRQIVKSYGLKTSKLNNNRQNSNSPADKEEIVKERDRLQTCDT